MEKNIFEDTGRGKERRRAESLELVGVRENIEVREKDSVGGKRRRATDDHSTKGDTSASGRAASGPSPSSRDKVQKTSRGLLRGRRLSQEAGSPYLAAVMHSPAIERPNARLQLGTSRSPDGPTIGDVARDDWGLRLLTLDQRRRIEFCFVRTTSDVTQKFPLDPVANTTKRFSRWQR